MSDFRFVTETFAVSPQISADDVGEAGRQGFTLIINNRPDGEAPGQPTAAAIEAAARAAGLDYLWIPVRGAPTPEQAVAVQRAAADGKVLAFCRSGTRSITAWAMGQAQAGAEVKALARCGAAAGYDLSWLG